MKNYVIGTLVVALLVLSSIIYKNQVSPRNKFPVLREPGRTGVETPLFLYVFFSKNNCIDCLEIIKTLNRLPSHFVVIGIVPQNQLENERELREITGAAFPLMSAAKYKRFTPWYSPSIMGISPEGDIVFVLPGIPGEREYLARFLNGLYEKLYPIFLKKKISQE